jgi:exosortase
MSYERKEMPQSKVFGVPTRALVWGGSLGVLAVLFVLWPYSHWAFETRQGLLPGLGRTFWHDAEWFFCIYVPLIVGYLVWRKRTALAKLPLEGEWWGLGLLLLGGAAYWVGYRVDTSYPGYAAAHLCSAGLIILFGGRRWMRELAFPWVFLAFAWPLIPLEDRVSVPLRMLMAKTSGLVINAIGIDVVREGTQLFSAADAAAGLKQGDRFMLEVDAPCAGMRSLFALIMISVVYAYMSLKKTSHRLTLVLAAFPLALVGNVVRMILLAIGCVLWGMDVAVGRVVDGVQEISAFHEIAGYVVFAVSLGGMFGIASYLGGRKGKRSSTNTSVVAGAEDKLDTKGLQKRFGAVVAFTALTLVSCLSLGQAPPLGEPGVVNELPLRVGEIQGIKGEPDQRELTGLAEDVTILRNFYILPNGGQAMCSMVISGAERRSLHRPEICLPAQGWNVLSSNELPVTLEDGRELRLKIVQLQRDYKDDSGELRRIKALNAFFYAGSEGVVTADYYDHVMKTYIHSLTKNLSHRWALLSFYLPYSEAAAGQGDPMADLAAIESVRQLVAAVAPKVIKSVP